MRILLSNDDGYLAPGLVCLAEELSSIAEITVVAPDRNRSGASNSLTIHCPIRATRAANGFIYVDGTPTDCVHLAITALMAEPADIVVSGINAGFNLGDVLLYSGTVAAAMEGRSLGLPAIAVSLEGREPVHYPTAARVVRSMLAHMMDDNLSAVLPANTLLNVNVPDVAYEDLQGFEVTRLSHEHKAEGATVGATPSGETIYWVGPAAGPEHDAGPGTDFFAVRRKKVSITPIRVELTSRSALEPLSTWAKGIRWD
uniref:5'-nucleotidase SurE n=1 Tax=Candidatus Kentrum eta TaxID=2126337 RepID=A0A450UDK9_9GAMM|nr:MAG: 5'-nucleotidase /3'-nucleotidase /exopolyphosphatase [Candidatus Kentron sp. H]VFJ90510.1 MAG: 5'-nucleotidase /3'-nucleotidase /exopolyphosphatase [Candidatus Kentron sp. H]VFJ96676.1 MAG: 5'-nucleotidase /3'-nucleotidase /exopolyphosphatase [Candidatus Kentron sp. H]